ncbi:YaaA family protein [Luteimicrobium subarcticum]|uniref:Peroxide stress protein YaaA n=1 Tax=Luteimicrobium subarcticum TaxID=620910 RepID=A0A2M8WR80_9MICO|nr:peroxide stress protein YaaA [Luteimicrobium subarcticum]PJI93437.1 hypothetical protein CLV34_2010 [Luteimicrobium subarcticum]
MLVVLPPSEGKTPAATGPAVELASLSAPELTEHRERVLDALAAVSARPDALELLGVGASLADDVARNTRLRTEPAAHAAHVYTGVLYAAARLGEALADGGVPASRLADVLTVSALWGAVTPLDRVPAYRLSMGTDLPGVGPLARAWREPLAKALDARGAGDVVVDCRSASYAAAWKPPADAEHVQVVILREHQGRRSVVSHHAKHTRGVLTGHLVHRDGAPPRSAGALLEAARELVGDVRDGRRILAADLVAGRGRAQALQVVVTDV